MNANYDNKASFDNYVYYLMIRKKIKFSYGVFWVMEMIYMYYISSSYITIMKKLFMPAFILLLIKDGYIFLFKREKNKAFRSTLGSIAVMCILTIELTILDLDVVTPLAVMFFPNMIAHFILYRSELIENSLSELVDYPYFKTELYKPGETAGYVEFSNSRQDKFLKSALRSTEISSYSKVARIVKYVSLGVIALGMITLVTSTTELFKLNSAESIKPGTTYSNGEYIEFEVENYFAGEAVEDYGRIVGYWVCISGTDKYLYIKTDKRLFLESKQLSSPVLLKGKVTTLNDSSMYYNVVGTKLLGEDASNDDKIKKAKEVCFNNVQIIVKDTYDMTDKILTWVIAVFTGIGVYAITDIIMKRKFS